MIHTLVALIIGLSIVEYMIYVLITVIIISSIIALLQYLMGKNQEKVGDYFEEIDEAMKQREINRK